MDLRSNEVSSLGHDWINIVNIRLLLSLIDSISQKPQPWPIHFFQCWLMHIRWRRPANQFRTHLAASPWMPCALTFSISLPLYRCLCHMCLWLGHRNRARLSGSYVCFWSHIESHRSGCSFPSVCLCLPLTNLCIVLHADYRIRLMGL